MNSSESSSAASSAIDAPPVSPSTPPVPLRASRIWAFALLASLVAGLGAFLIHEKVGMRIIPTPNMVRIMGQLRNLPTYPAIHRAERKNAAVYFGILGGALAMVVGLAGGLARGSLRSGIVAAIVGLLLGGSVGAAAVVIIAPFYHHELERNPELESDMLAQPILMHAGIWAAIGAATGTALGIGLGRPRLIPSTLLGGLVGGAMAAMAYEIIGGLVFLTGTSEAISPKWPVRLTVALSGSIFVATLAAFAAVSPTRRVSRKTPELLA
jgi:hypothetical protein